MARRPGATGLFWVCMLVGLGCLILAVAGAVTVGSALRTAAVAQSDRKLDQVAGAMAEQVTQSFRAAELVLQDVGRRVDTEAARQSASVVSVMRSAEIHERLSQDVRRATQLDAIVLVAPGGELANWSGDRPAGSVAIALRDAVAQLAAAPADQELLISPLPIGAAGGRPAVILSRRLQADAVVMAVMPVDPIERAFAEAAAQPGVAVTLMLDNGAVVAHAPDADGRLGTAASLAAYRGRMSSIRDLTLYGMRLVVSVPKSQALARWRSQAMAIGVVTTAASVCVLLMMAALVRQTRAQRVAQSRWLEQNHALEELNRLAERQTQALAGTADALRDQEALLADRSNLMATTLQYIDQGVLMVDADEVVVVYNQRACEILDLPADLLASQPKFRDILVYQLERGEFGRSSQSVVDLVRAGGVTTTPHHYQRERPDGRVIEVCSLPLPGGGMVRTYSDITERKLAQAQVERAALIDDLTGLPNRLSLRRHLDDRLRAGADEVALLYINLDRFRLLNDARGHVTGDALLQAVASRLAESVPATDLLSRTGGDEFALAHGITPAQDDSSEQAATLLRRLSEPYVIDGRRLTITASIGVATAATGTTTDILLRNADIAMYRAKDGGRNQLCRYEPAMATEQLERFHLEQSLREALGTPAFRLVYQPIISLAANEIAGFEALLRWTDPVRGEVSPATFIPIAETTGLIVPLGRSALTWACTEAASWSKPRTVAVNLSPAQFLGDDLIALVKEVLTGSRLEPNRLELEVTEGMLLQDTGTVRDTMFALRDLGVSLTLDDFGTGHAGLSYLRRFPFQKFKIDRSFIRNLGRAREADTIVEEMLLLARRLDLQVVAEGVELEAQLERLKQLGCTYVQGYFTGRPANAEVVREL